MGYFCQTQMHVWMPRTLLKNMHCRAVNVGSGKILNINYGSRSFFWCSWKDGLMCSDNVLIKCHGNLPSGVFCSKFYILDDWRRYIDMSQMQQVHSLGNISVLKCHFRFLYLSRTSGNFRPTVEKRLECGGSSSGDHWHPEQIRNLGVAVVSFLKYLALEQ